ncbi:hypothetical protein, partial [Salmonella sp. SAL4360]|uniref:hypothetical protein n=1 Tax=Salmonella sp. SAL4360 TaxID=3159881 RepID=UPI003978AA7D
MFTARGTVGQVGLIPSCEELGWDSAILSANQLRYRPSNPELDPEFIWYLFSSWFVLTQVY